MSRIDKGLGVLVVVLLISSSATADELVATLSLDGLSFLSFEDQRVLSIPAGSVMRFHFADSSGAGSVDFTLGPGDVSIAPISLPGSADTLSYGLGSGASGSLRRMSDGSVAIEFSASVAVTLTRPEGVSTHRYPMHFTTDRASAANADGSRTVQVEGVDVVLGARYVQLVGATTNHEAAPIEPGAAAYAVLSGSFDVLPSLH
jgi:hypothetical protein